MSEVRPLAFRRVDDAQPALAPAPPQWLAPRDAVVRPAPFASVDEGPTREGSAREASESEPDARRAVPEPPPPPPRRSSIPPRRSLLPPQISVSRLPPPPAALEASVSPQQEAFVNAALELGALRAHVYSGIESELLSLAVHIAEAILEREVRLDPSVQTTLARTAVLALGDTQAARLKVSREAFKAITELHGEPAIDVDGVRVEVSMDASFEALDVVAEAGPSRVDGKVRERLASVLRAMEAEHRRNNAENVGAEEP